MITHEKETPSRCPFVRSGRIAYSISNPLGLSGQYGLYWSSARYSDGANYAYFLSFNSNEVNPSSGNQRYDGRPLRCLAS